MVYSKNMTPAQKQYRAIKAAPTYKEKELINYYELMWNLKQKVPTVTEVAKYIKQTEISVNYYLTRYCVKKALDDRGIPWQQHSQSKLTTEQVAAAIVVMNFADERPISVKLDQLGVNVNQYQAWIKDPQFKNLIDNLADQNLANIRPTAIAEFTKKINQGDWQAVKFFLETTGELQHSEMPQSEQLIRMLIEVIQRHVKDPETIIAIAQDMKLVTANRTLETAVYESTAVDVDLSVARKQLGV